LSTPSAVVFDDVSFDWPDGSTVLSHLTASFTLGRTGLVGANGAGKTTVLRLMAGELRQTAGSLVTTGTVDFMRQDVTRGSTTVADLLGVSDVRRALRAVESGSTDPAVFDVIGDGWDIEDRARAELAALGLPTELDRVVSHLSGGEAMLAATAGVRLRGADIVLLDEPTNNLDADARERAYDLVRSWRGTLIVVSHDLELLDLMDSTAELRDSEITTFGGPYSEYRLWLDAQQQAARRTLRAAEQALKREQRERAKAEERIAHSERQGRKDRANRKYVAAVVDDRRNSAQKAQGARRASADAKVLAARDAVDTADRMVRDDDHVHIDLADPHVPARRRIVEVRAAGDDWAHVMMGPERIGIVGPNGAGKTTLIENVMPQAAVRTAYLPQRIDLDDGARVLETVCESAPGLSPGDVRNRLARLRIRGDMVERPVGTLSGGERFRVALARLLLADPPPELLVLDEPTNDLDIYSVDQLVAALDAYRGALLVVSHDQRFLARLGLDVVLRLDAGGTLRPVGWGASER
jgi:ATPase subunit of ABC transporter with duplicated ATPase domains